MTDHYVVEQAAPKWINTALTSVGATLCGGLLLWIANGQQSMATEQAVIRQEVQQLRAANKTDTEAVKRNLTRIEDLMNQVWPRLRVHGENIAILKAEIERICKCKVELKEPEKF